MHELGLCEAILDAWSDGPADGRVTRRAGAGRRAAPGASPRRSTSRSPWLPQGTVADGAAVDLVVVPVRGDVRGLRRTSPRPRTPLARLLAVRRRSTSTLTGGDELILESIQYDGGRRMCLASPVRSSSSCDDHPDLAKVDVSGVRRAINIGLLEDEDARARRLGADPRRLRPVQDRRGRGKAALDFLEGIGQAYDDELAALADSDDRSRRRRAMRFVDEFRDADKARALAAQIAALCEPGRHYKFMEVCGGHTHTIYKHGLEDYLPESVDAGARPGLPGLRDPDGPGRRRHRHRRAARRDHDLVRRHDAGARRQRLVLRRQGRRRRHPDGLLAAGRAEDRPAEPRQAGGVHGHRVRDHRAVHGDDRAAGRGRGASRTSRSSATTSRSSRPSRRSSTRPTCASTGSSAPATCRR